MLSEFDAIELLARELAARGPGVDLGIGDDAALLGHIQGKLVLSVDSAIEHTHFERDWLSPEALGARALHSAASDLAAMGAAAVAGLVERICGLLVGWKCPIEWRGEVGAIATVCRDETRRDVLRNWTQSELRRIRLPQTAI